MASLTPAAPATPSEATPPGPLALYGALGDARAERVPRRLWPVVAEGAFVAAYVFLRLSDAPRDLLAVWVAAAAILALVHPGSGLTVFAVMAVFSEPFVLTRDLGVKPVILAALAAGVALRLVRRPRDFPWSLPIALGMLLAAGTLVGVAVTALRTDDAQATAALIDWVAGPATVAIVLTTAAWAARSGSLRPLIAVTVAGVLAGAVSLADFLDATSIRGTPLDWMVRPTRFELRLSGVISSPNGVAALVVGPFAVCAAAAILGRRLPVLVRGLAAGGAGILALAMYFTYSRAALLGIFVVAVVIAWRIRRWMGAGLLVAGIVAGGLLLPGYLVSRNAAVGAEGTVDPSGVLVASDIARFNAWRASVEIWADNPLIGIGFSRYGSIADAYGDAALNSPHNEWLRLFAEGGIVVGLVGAAWIAVTVITLARVPGWVGAGALATALGWGVASTFNNPLLFIQVSTVAFTIMGTGLARARGWPITRGASPAPSDAVPAEAARGDATDVTPDDTTPAPPDPRGQSATAPPPMGA